MKTVLDMWVPGEPVPQGSMSAIPLGRRVGGRFVPITKKDGTPIINVVSSNEKRLKPWRAAVTQIARSKFEGRVMIDGRVTVTCEFVFVRPAAHYHQTIKNNGLMTDKGRLYPAPIRARQDGDTDKLERAILDALDAADVFADDTQVDELHGRKVWGSAPGARVWVQVPEPIPPSMCQHDWQMSLTTDHMVCMHGCGATQASEAI